MEGDDRSRPLVAFFEAFARVAEHRQSRSSQQKKSKQATSRQGVDFIAQASFAMG